TAAPRIHGARSGPLTTRPPRGGPRTTHRTATAARHAHGTGQQARHGTARRDPGRRGNASAAVTDPVTGAAVRSGRGERGLSPPHRRAGSRPGGGPRCRPSRHTDVPPSHIHRFPAVGSTLVAVC